MDAKEAITWVHENSRSIDAYVRQHENSVPSRSVYMQEAFIAALKAYRLFPATSTEPFEKHFWHIFADALVQTASNLDRQNITPSTTRPRN